MFSLKPIVKYSHKILNYFNKNYQCHNCQEQSNYFNLFSQLNKLTKNHAFSLLFEKGETWIIINNDIYLQYNNKFNSVSSIILDYGNFEEVELELVHKNLSEKSVFFDIGANVGLYSLSAARQFNNIEIHAFEPVPDTFRELKNNLEKNQLNSKIIINQLAVSNTNESVYMTTDYHSSNYMTESTSLQNKIEVTCTTIDDYVEKYSIQKIDFIKIDVEGQELLVLQGCEQCLKKFKPILLVEIIEQENIFFDRKFQDYMQVINYLTDLGYKYYQIDDNKCLIPAEKLAEAKPVNSYHNYLFYYDKVNLL